jgi:hypothetical protein
MNTDYLTVEQFLGETPNHQDGEERTREYLLSNNDTKDIYLYLSRRLLQEIDKQKSIEENH